MRQALRLRLCVTASLAALAASATTVMAQAPAVEEAPSLEEVVVTAQRREENLQDVPVSVTALTAAQLEERQVTDVRVLSNTVPNVWFGSAIGDPTDITLGIRGIPTPGTQLVQDSAAPVYVDGVYLARTSGSNTAMIDMERVEILRGPQGTLFGRNTIGGALSITTAQPTNTLGGSVKLSVGNYELGSLTAVLNTPLTENVAARFVYQLLSHDGYGRSSTTGQDLNSLKQHYVRASLKADFNADWTLVLTGDYQDTEGDAGFVKLGFMNPASPFNATLPALNGRPGDLISNYVGGDFYTSQANGLYRNKSHGYSGTATLTGRLGAVSVKSITGYRKFDTDRPVDLDGTPYNFVELPFSPMVYDQFSEELQAYGDALDGRLSWITGLYYFEEDGFQRSDSFVISPILPTTSIVDYDATNTSKGAFIQVSFEILPRLKLTGGVRYTKDTREVVYHDRLRNNTTGVETCSLRPSLRGAGFCNLPAKVSFDYWPYTIGLDFKPNDDTLLYAKFSKGYRSGGFAQSTNPALLSVPFVEPENLISPEVGGKFDLLNRRLRINTAIYYSEYKNIQQQINTVRDNVPVAIQQNVGDGHIWGGEFEAEALLGDFRLRGALGLIDPKFDAGPSVGTPFLQLSKTTWSVSGSYPIEMDEGTLTVSADYGWRSKQYYVTPIPGNDAATAALSQKGFGLLNAQASYELRDTPLTFTVWGRNLTDEEYKTRSLSFIASFGAAIFLPGDPRTYGVTVSSKF